MGEETQPDPKDKLLQEHYKKRMERLEQHPGAKKFAQGYLILIAIVILLGWGWYSYTLLVNPHTVVWGVLLAIAAIIFAFFYIRAAVTKTDYSKIKYKQISGYMNFMHKVGNNSFLIKVVKFGWRRPLVAIVAISILIIAISNPGHSIFFDLFYAFLLIVPLFIAYMVFFAISAAHVVHYGPKEVKEFIKNDEVAPTGWLNPSANTIDLPFGWKMTIPEGWKAIRFLYLFFHKTKPSEIQKKAQEETKRNAQKAYKTKFRKPILDAKPTRKKSKAV